MGWLELNENKLDGTIPQSLCHIGDSLTEFLLLNHNKLSGRIPDCFGTSFPNLATMQLQDNSLTGGLPQTWSPTNALNSLMVSNNPDLGGKLPDSLFKMSDLRQVIAEGSGLKGSLPLELCNATSLESLYLASNEIHGELPLCITNLTNLKELSAPFNNIEGTIPTSLDKMVSLKKFDLSSVSLLSEGPYSPEVARTQEQA